VNAETTKWQTRPVVLALLFVILLASRDRPPQHEEDPTIPQFRLLTYNVDWGCQRPDLTAEIIRKSGAEIVCLQETTPRLEAYLRQRFFLDYSFAEFRDSGTRMGGGFAFLSKVPAREIAFVQSDSGWFAGWIMEFQTKSGPVQVINVHLHPPVSDSGNWNGISDYFSTENDRVEELKRFFSERRAGLVTLVAGDFNEDDGGRALEYLKSKNMTSALPQFDQQTPTWQGRVSFVTLSLRLDHILYSSELRCLSARVIREGASDHFPVEAVFAR
jgi:endonuclease/exonuclease/phosphatase family metal-dependent hydrolase